jgi:hypothetical protein
VKEAVGGYGGSGRVKEAVREEERSLGGTTRG